MQITAPSTIENNPLYVTIAGVKYTLAPGSTITVPDEVAEEMFRMIAAKNKPAPGVDLPFENAEVNQAIADILDRLEDIEAFLPELPDLPDDDGAYGLQLVVDDGEGTLTWEDVEAGE